MENQKKTRIIGWVAGGILLEFIISMVLLLILAFGMYQMDLETKYAATGISLIYIVSCFCGGWWIGRRAEYRKYLWGVGIGLLYFLILFGISIIFGKMENGSGLHTFYVLILCILGGMLGGMVS